MKQLTGSFFNISIIFALLMNLLYFPILICTEIEIDWSSFVGLLFLNVFIWIIAHQSNSTFLYDNQKLIVSNSWMPFIHKEYMLREIESVYVCIAGQLGRSIIIVSKTGDKKAWGASHCTKEELEEFAQFLNDQITKK